MKGHPTDFWGKFDETNGTIEWHPLEDHCVDVAACFQNLIAKTLWRRRLATAGGLSDLSPIRQARLSVLALLHDAGKYNLGFQAKVEVSPKLIAGHQQPLLDCFYCPGPAQKPLFDALGIHEMQQWVEGDEENFFSLFIAAISHHGRPLQPKNGFSSRLWARRGNLEPLEGIRKLIDKAKNWFPEAFREISGETLPATPLFQHAFSGILMLADWLASDRKFFPYTEKEEDRVHRMKVARERAATLFQTMTLDPSYARSSMGENCPPFSSLFPGRQARGCQLASSSLPVSSSASLAILEAETGAGKTEAALAYFAKLFHAGEVDGLYFALPTRTAASQIYKRLVAFIDQAFSGAKPNVVLAVPGYLQVDGVEGVWQGRFEAIWDDEENWFQQCRGWASENSKRFLAGSIVVGTIDQALLGVLTVKHAHMRSSCLLRHLLVVDEVHASDAYMNAILEKVLDYHLACGGHAFLMSATLGSSAKVALGRKINKRHPPLDFEKAKKDPYPQLFYGSAAGESKLFSFGSGFTKEIVLSLRGIMQDPEQIAQCALEAALQGAKVLVIRNTVQGALAVQNALERLGSPSLLFQAAGKITLHHSRFAKEDRETLDRTIEAGFGGRREEGGKVVVGTQTVQQSLDLDADFLLTDLCPIDVLLQRMGRLHRHQRQIGERPFAYRTTQTVVCTPQEQNLEAYISKDGKARGPDGLGTVYEDLRMLDLTWKSLIQYQTLVIPEMNRALVEFSLHRAQLNLYNDREGVWAKHAGTMNGTDCAKKNQARYQCIPFDKCFGEELAFPNAEEGKIQTRLGLGDRCVRFSSSVTTPFGNKMETLQMPAWLCKDISADIMPKIVCSRLDETVFELEERSFIYDRHGLRRCDQDNQISDQEDEADA